MALKIVSSETYKQQDKKRVATSWELSNGKTMEMTTCKSGLRKTLITRLCVGVTDGHMFRITPRLDYGVILKETHAKATQKNIEEQHASCLAEAVTPERLALIERHYAATAGAE